MTASISVNRFRIALAAIAVLLGIVGAPAASAAEECGRLGGGERIGNATVVLAQPVAAGN